MEKFNKIFGVTDEDEWQIEIEKEERKVDKQSKIINVIFIVVLVGLVALMVYDCMKTRDMIIANREKLSNEVR